MSLYIIGFYRPWHKHKIDREYESECWSCVFLFNTSSWQESMSELLMERKLNRKWKKRSVWGSLCVVVLVLYAVIFAALRNCALSGAAAVRAGRDSALCALLMVSCSLSSRLSLITSCYYSFTSKWFDVKDTLRMTVIVYSDSQINRLLLNYDNLDLWWL